MNNGYDPSPVGAVGLEPSKGQSSASDFDAALRDVPILIQLPDLGGSFETPEPSFSVASELDDEYGETSACESETADPLSPGEGDWKEADEPKSNWLSRSLTIAFMLGLLGTAYWLYQGSDNSPSAPGLGDWKKVPPVAEVGPKSDPSLANGVDPTPGNSIHTAHDIGQSLEQYSNDGSMNNSTAQLPLPDFTPSLPSIAETNATDGVGPRISESGYPITDPSSYRYEEEMPFMRFGLRVEPIVPYQNRTTQQ
ncbi:MAG: hypothetical protein ACI9HK_004171 [Pirellulaceae bacterium]|jgi:hypothetical protein